jgi:4-diphosphocytidyl-2-C-methyl-D-erythritol kinase
VKGVHAVLTESAFAKLNLSLDITGRRRDGYHLLSMVNVSISLQDMLSFDRMPDGGLQVRCVPDADAPQMPPVPDGKENLVYRAAETFFSLTGETDRNVCMTVHKKIPSQAGLAGGSSDAAAALRGLCRLYGCAVSPKALCRMAETIGADVPFCVQGGTVLVKGIGEILTPLAPIPACWFVVCKPPIHVRTAEAYHQLDAAQEVIPQFTPGVLKALQQKSLPMLGCAFGNAFAVALPLPEVKAIQKRMLQAGALGACMTGSGSAVFGLFDEKKAAETVYEKLRKEYPCTYLCQPTEAIQLPSSSIQ